MKNSFQPMLAEPTTLILSAFFLLMLFGTVIICAVIAVVYLLAKKRETKNPVPLAKPTPVVSPTNTNLSNCPQCGTPFSSDAIAGLCPACLLKMGAATDTVTDAKQAPFIPPATAELAAKFPQLEILELIGKGGMGAVYKARQKQLDRIVALKILPPDIGSDPAFAERFTREAKALAKLNHPNIVTLYEFGEASRQFYFLMEFVDGVNLRQLLQNRPVSAREALAIVPQICDALQFAHDQGIVHRDIKPENILLDRRGRVKVADFGLAKIIGGENEIGGDKKNSVSENLTDAGKIMGTPNYMSPEQKENPGDANHRADIYALGVVFYQMLTGELPGKKIEPPSRKVHIDVRLDEIVLRALEKKPERRYQQASVLKTQVETVAATPEKTGIQNPRFEIKSRLTRAVIVAAIVFCLFFVLAATIIFSLPKTYQSTARVMFHNDKLDTEKNADEFSWILRSVKNFPQTPLVLDKAAKDLDLKHKWSKQYGGTELSDEAVRRQLQNHLTVALVPNTSLVSINAYSDNPKEASDIANKIAETTRALIPQFKFSSGEKFDAQVVDSAMPAARPIRPNIYLNLFFGIVIGIFLGLVAAAVSLLFKSKAYSTSPSIQKPDRFWRWFAVAVFAFISIPVVIAIFGLLAAIAIPNFVRARAQAQANTQHAAQNNPFSSTTNFFIGQTYFPKGDSIEITSMERTENQMTVKGHYHLVSADEASLWLNITATNNDEVPNQTEPPQSLHISRGAGDFELSRSQLVPGLPHVSMYDNHHSFAGIYFGTEAEALASRKLNLSDYLTKTIVLARATNQLIGAAKDLPTVTIFSDTFLSPGEKIRALVKLPDGQITDAQAILFTRSAREKITTSSSFSWFFKDGFGATEAEAAVAQLQKLEIGRPLALANSQPLELFSVTNQQGGVMTGYAEFDHVDPQPTDASGTIKATVRIQRFGIPMIPSISISADVPPGFALRATANTGEASSFTPSGPDDYNCVWFRPFRPQQRLPSKAPQWLVGQGSDISEPFEVILGEPKLVFTITNGPGDVFEGFLELVGPTNKTN